MKDSINIFAVFVISLMAMATDETLAEAMTGSASSEIPGAANNKDYFYLSGEKDALSPTGSGGGGSVEWTHSMTPKLKTSLGYSRLNIAGSNVNYLKLGAYWKGESAVAYHVEARGGAGNQNAASFGYQTLKGGIAFPLREKLSLELEDEYIRADQTSVNLVKSTITYVPLAWLGGVAKYQVSTGGSIRMNSLSGELDFYVNGMKIYGGYSSGSYFLNQDFILNSSVLNTAEQYYGIKFPVSSNEVDLIWNSISQPGTQKRSVTFAIKAPL